MKFASAIHIDGARTHNLRNVRCDIPHGALTVVTGVSGSGKSSLAFDTLYAEGQRRYVESMSTYARQFLERMQRPDVDAVLDVPPAIAIEQRNSVKNARSTVGTATEVADYLRLLYARIGELHCPTCGAAIVRDTAEAAGDEVLRQWRGERLFVVAPTPVGHDAGTHLSELAREGYYRLLLDGVVVRTDELGERLGSLRQLPLVIDRLRLDDETLGRLTEALEQAFSLAAGRAEVFVEGRSDPLRFAEGYRCRQCDLVLRPPQPASFSYNSPLGACPACQGFGRIIGIDFEKVIPDGRKSLREGAIVPFQTPSGAECQDDLEKGAKREKVRLDVPWNRLTKREQKWVLEGDPGYKAGGWKRGQWYGIRGFFRYLETKKYKMHVRVLLSRYRGYHACSDCQGSRLKKEAQAVRAGGRSIAELESMPVGDLLAFVRHLPTTLAKQARATARPLLAEIESRLAYLDEVGLSYLTLLRQTRTLSGGESQRIALASALGSQLTGTLYVLDEPSVGLHPRDTHRLLEVLRRLTARGNTVVVVEHEPEVMRAADHIVDLGEGAGALGGSVVFEGSYRELLSDHRSATARFLRGRQRSVEKAAQMRSRRGVPEGFIRLFGACAHNLKSIEVSFPMGRFSCVTGVSGSGKSTLLVDVLFAQAERQRGRPVDFVGACDGTEGLDAFEDVVLVDQSPIGRSSRSNPATYLKAMDELRHRFAATEEAKRLGLGPGAFSFNVSAEKGGGRCEVCQGQGTVTLEMHFLADVTVGCDGCGGRRFTEKVLAVKVRGLSILDCLGLTVDEALVHFVDDDKIVQKLLPFAEVGLGYLQLGQSTATLSGGESQRLKLAAHFEKKARAAPRSRIAGTTKRPSLFLLDEPTTGLHGLDVEVLLRALDRLVAEGHTVIAIEHNIDFLLRADHLVDLGPEGGEAGGRVVAAGAPEEVSRVRASHTGQLLRPLLAGRRRG